MERPTQHLSINEAAEALGVHYMTAYRYVRTGRLPATKVGHEWRIDPDDVRLLREPDDATARASPPGSGRARERTRALINRLTRSDEAGAWTIVDEATRSGAAPDGLYLELLAPALREIGERWARGDCTVAEEHQASALVMRIIGRLGPRFARRGRRRGTVVVGAPPGDLHGLPSAFLSDLLRGRSFDVIDLGADVPVSSWATTCSEAPRLVGVGLCASSPGNDSSIAEVIDAIRAHGDVPIILGGGAVEDAAHARRVGASAYSDSFASAIAHFDTDRRADRDRTSERPAS